MAIPEPNGELRRNSQWQLALSVLVVAGGIVSWVYNVASKVDRHDGELTEIRQQNTRSIDDRGSLSKQVLDNRDAIAKLQEGLSKELSIREAALTEVECQIDATSQSMNAQISELHRLNAVSWPHITGLGSYPAGPYTQPNISNRRVR